jgi:dTDP-4-dehydrorhamnose reductase
MKPRILLTGKNGQLGGELLQFLPQCSQVIAPGRQELDLTDPGQIRRMVREVRPHVIVNAAAYTAVDQAENEEGMARAVNAEAPAVLAQESKKIGAAIIHLSTDYVFDGTKNSPYIETDPTSPINLYGKTKLEGELAIKSTGLSHLIFRASWIYGTRGRNFLLTVLRLASQQDELRIIRDQIGAPTWSRVIAQAIVRILQTIPVQKGDHIPFSEVSGTYNMTAGGEASWYEFAEAILQEASAMVIEPSWISQASGGKAFRVRNIVPITTPEYPTAARRPAYSVLSNSRFEQTFGFRLPDWRVQLHCMFSEAELSTHR